MAYNATEKKVLELVTPIAEQNNVSVWDVEFKKEGQNQVLRVYIDKEGGISIDDCEAVSRRLEEELDRGDFIKSAYMLEVSSAGIDRALKRDSDFLMFLNHKVDVKLYSPIDGVKEFTALLSDYKEKTMLLKTEDGKEINLPLEKASSVRLTVEF